MIIDAGIGRPSHAAEAMEMGHLRSCEHSFAVSGDPLKMATAFKDAVRAGRQLFLPASEVNLPLLS